MMKQDQADESHSGRKRGNDEGGGGDYGGPQKKSFMSGK